MKDLGELWRELEQYGDVNLFTGQRERRYYSATLDFYPEFGQVKRRQIQSGFTHDFPEGPLDEILGILMTEKAVGK